MVVLARPELPHKVHTDASTADVGAVLLKHHSQGKPYFIHHMTMVLAIPQHKHTIGVMECMAMCWHTTQVV